jgi:molybdopterin-guanine dinucleotide biosynthesis protein A
VETLDAAETKIGETAPPCASSTAAIVLAGGKSTRFGRDKAFLELDGQPLATRTIAKLAKLTDELIIVSNDPAPYELLDLPARIVPDVRPGEGSLMGLYSGLKVVRSDQAVCVACDMPFLSLGLLRYMLRLAPDYDVVVPRIGRFMEPLHAIYSKSCLMPMETLLARGRRQIIAFYDDVRVRYVDAEEVDAYDPLRLSFLNVNTPEDWARVQRLLADHH